MSVVEFSADAWQASSPGLQTGIARRMEAVGQLQQGLEALAASEKISGQGADAMRAYIGEVHVPIVQLLQLGLSTFHTAIGVYWSGYRQVDSGGNFRLVRDEFQAHLAQLEGGMEQLRGFTTQLRRIAADASHLVSLGGAGAGAVEQTVNDLQGMHAIAKGQKESWEAYEASDPGFGQVKDLIAQLAGIVNNVGALTVGQGRSYTAGSFTLTLQQLGPLTSGMLDYCKQSQKAATAGWESLFSGYAKDIEAAEAARREQAGWDLIWDGLQIVAGAVVTVIGLGLTPFTGGFSLGLTVLGGSLLIGGINNAINHVSIATTGNDLNLVGMAGQAVDEWWTANAVKPAAASGSWGLEFLAGVGSGVVHVISDAGQLNVHEAGMGVTALFTDPRAFAQAWDQITTTVGQVAAFNPSVMGELAGALLPGAAALKAARAAGVVGKAGELASDLGKTVKLVEPGKAVSAPSGLKNRIGADDPTIVKKDFPHGTNPVEVSTPRGSGVLSGIPGVSVVGDKVLINGVEKMTIGEWNAIRTASVHNTSSSQVTLGKWEGPDSPNSYTNKAIEADSHYFDLGSEWTRIRTECGLRDEDMFDLFNRPFLDDIIQQAKSIRFTHNPLGDEGALGDELEYLLERGYSYDEATMTARKIG